jgi:hypothetical protein
VAVIDIPNAFVQTHLENKEDKAITRLRGKFAKLILKVAPKIYTEYVIINPKGETVLYVCLLNALYGIMKAALLYYQCFVTDLQSIGFSINPYDPCVANKNVKGKQLTVVWHVKDLKVSHKKPSVLARMAEWLKYERLFDNRSGGMTISRGKIHNHLSMTLDFTIKGKVKITMTDYVEDMLLLFSKHNKSNTTVNTPAAEHLFKVNKESTPLT